ncbi:hypothetical protein XOC_1424 [Xanthomonas oryzae pv. oryzicola BLS256]|uniref:Uncharacterized protein n=1 Tax=Xanthomonas oryzae pv. oryzicola (strain BLS256) TaxID=383407 RepID=G7TIX7_XANOB|nr:hypothetical protein XOC_1424 [Xanthomonas oryzae pv. oryzicola BLS256]QEO98500.1 hypothetical protein XOCgx_3511 [Xanthomonas oryzae pv. oryzicola]
MQLLQRVPASRVAAVAVAMPAQLRPIPAVAISMRRHHSHDCDRCAAESG